MAVISLGSSIGTRRRIRMSHNHNGESTDSTSEKEESHEGYLIEAAIQSTKEHDWTRMHPGEPYNEEQHNKDVEDRKARIAELKVKMNADPLDRDDDVFQRTVENSIWYGFDPAKMSKNVLEGSQHSGLSRQEAYDRLRRYGEYMGLEGDQLEEYVENAETAFAEHEKEYPGRWAEEDKAAKRQERMQSIKNKVLSAFSKKNH